MSSGSAHTALVNAALLAIGQRDDVFVWKNQTGAARAIDNPKRVIPFGLLGSADIFAIVGPHGRFVGLEAKTGGGRQSKQQRNFEAAVRTQGGDYQVFRNVDEAVAAIDRARGLR